MNGKHVYFTANYDSEEDSDYDPEAEEELALDDEEDLVSDEEEDLDDDTYEKESSESYDPDLEEYCKKVAREFSYQMVKAKALSEANRKKFYLEIVEILFDYCE